jgi:cell division protein FtsB
VKRLAFPAVLLLAVYYAVFGGEYSVADLDRTRVQVEQAARELHELEAEARRLEARVTALETDARTLERLAREDIGMIREGEVLYRFADGGEPRMPEVDTRNDGR